jgi:hypothetical protein
MDELEKDHNLTLKRASRLAYELRALELKLEVRHPFFCGGGVIKPFLQSEIEQKSKTMAIINEKREKKNQLFLCPVFFLFFCFYESTPPNLKLNYFRSAKLWMRTKDTKLYFKKMRGKMNDGGGVEIFYPSP